MFRPEDDPPPSRDMGPDPRAEMESSSSPVLSPLVRVRSGFASPPVGSAFISGLIATLSFFVVVESDIFCTASGASTLSASVRELVRT